MDIWEDKYFPGSIITRLSVLSMFLLQIIVCTSLGKFLHILKKILIPFITSFSGRKIAEDIYLTMPLIAGWLKPCKSPLTFY